ncbi:putative glucan endo-1,3-beta-glucosidase BG4 [Cinnamomum micranthum f. kanehirae]|uniref:Putative glucan endo-1,3-beta-glucosidase BG4 n=1 Tax=Cinnamomum micranthum f. kanehirae TaxID=337451 RepID=A0A443P731_9MAGN|nr:putative glucan endo-1,3-beta-glucosidase BG4 [Cinnamomum micranthum f. kanehirae]
MLEDKNITQEVYEEIFFSGAKYPIGVCYGMQGSNLPAPINVINLYLQYGIERIRPQPDVLQALKGSKLLVTLGVRNEDIASLASSQQAVSSWISTHVSAYTPDVEFKCISVGNEVIFTNEAMSAMYWAMEKVAGTNVGIVVAESDWPIAGNGDFTTPALAQAYNTNLKNHVINNGTPKRPNSLINKGV